MSTSRGYDREDSITVGRANDRWPYTLMTSATISGGVGANSDVV